jgi:hypothetical protein
MQIIEYLYHANFPTTRISPKTLTIILKLVYRTSGFLTSLVEVDSENLMVRETYLVAGSGSRVAQKHNDSK